MQYGSNLKALPVYFCIYQLLPYERASEMIFDLFGHSLSPATVVAVTGACSRNLTEVEGTTRNLLQDAQVLHVDETGMREHVVYSSFDSRAILHFKQIDALTPVAVLYEKKQHGLRLPSEIVQCLGADAFNCSLRELGEKWLSDLKLHGIPVHIYTVNDEKNMRRLLDLGIDGIFTNRPDVLRSVWEEYKGSCVMIDGQ